MLRPTVDRGIRQFNLIYEAIQSNFSADLLRGSRAA
jgi:hypothetical protein